MGTLARFRFSDELVERFPVFIETGTGRGVGIRQAQESGFKRILSVDTEKCIVTHARHLFQDDPRVEIHCDESVPFLRRVFAELDADVGVIIWLDAHFPGSDVLGVPYDSEPEDDRRLPLLNELSIIKSSHPRAVVLVDDLHLYLDGPFGGGNVSPESLGASFEDRRRQGELLYSTLAATHDVRTWYDEEGYLAFIPRGESGPTYVEYGFREYCESARKCLEIGDFGGANGSYERVVDLTDPPDTGAKRIARGEACRFFAELAHEKSNQGFEIDWYHRAIHADPLCIQYRLDFVNHALIPMKWLEPARLEADRACRIEPSNPMCWQTAANVAFESHDIKQAQEYIDRALEVGPENAGSHLIAAKLYADTARFDDAMRHYEIVLALPRSAHRTAETLHGMAIVRDRQNRTEQALELIDEALSIESGDKDLMLWNRAEMLLTLGRYAEGWPDHSVKFDSRYRGREFAAWRQIARRFKAPVLTLEDPPCRVHVQPDMGFGDIICVSRYIPLLVEMGHDVRFEVKSHMVELFQHSFPKVKVQEFALDYPGALGVEAFDRHVTSLAFPHVFGTTIDTVPWNGPYIVADEARIAMWLDRLPALRSPKLKVGLCWSSGIRHGIWYKEYGNRKSMSFAMLTQRLLDFDATFISLQAGPERLENKIIPGLIEAEPDWADTAALVANLDLVITVDTSIAHLAGAMGKPTWLMMHTQGSWHWMRERTDSPWYPTVRIFRQERPHEWGGVVDAVWMELRSLLSD